MYLKEGTYHTRLFRGPSTNGMKKWDGPMHWASNTPEVHVIPPHTVVLARQWLQQEGKVPKTGISAIANTSPLLYELLMTDTRSTDPLAGHFWQLSPQLQDMRVRAQGSCVHVCMPV